MTKPIPDKAEVAVEYPDKLYIGTFAQTARFDAHFDETGISLSLYREGGSDTRKSVRMHFHYALFAEILRDLARTAASVPPADVAHREELLVHGRLLRDEILMDAQTIDHSIILLFIILGNLAYFLGLTAVFLILNNLWLEGRKY